MKIKICGITNKEDALNAVSLGADAIGFIFSKNSPRYIDPEIAEDIAFNLPPFILVVGVFINQEIDHIRQIANKCKLDIIQLHGDETPGFCLQMPRRVIKAIKVSELSDIEKIPQYKGSISGILLDTKVQEIEGGTGKTFDWGLALKAKEYDIPLILAGGINSLNIKKAVNLVNPYAVDIASGVESKPGKKDYSLIEEVIKKGREL